MSSTGRSAAAAGGNVFDKYGSSNPIVRLLMRGFFRSFDELFSGIPCRSVLEVGCGEGEIGRHVTAIRPHASYYGVDVAPEVVAEARKRHPQLRFDVRSIHDLSPDDAADVVLAVEVFEHLPDPERAMQTLLRVPFQHLLVSVPREPVWRMLNVLRGRYLRDLGNTPGHVNHWSRRHFVAFLSRFDRHIEIERVLSPFPWTMVLCSRRE